MEQALVPHCLHNTSNGCFGSILFLFGMNSPQAGLGQKIRSSHGVENCKTLFRNVCCSSRVKTDLIVAPGIGFPQHFGGMFDSSDDACLMRTRRHLSQYWCKHGRVCKALLTLNSSRQQTQGLCAVNLMFHALQDMLTLDLPWRFCVSEA